MQLHYFYKISLGEKVYIGRTTNVRARANRHLSMLTKGSHHCAYLQNAFNQKGSETYAFEIICTDYFASYDEAGEFEEKLFDLFPNKYNMAKTGNGGGTNVKLTWDQVQEIRKRLGEWNKDLAKEFGVSPPVISTIKNNKSWRVPDPFWIRKSPPSHLYIFSDKTKKV